MRVPAGLLLLLLLLRGAAAAPPEAVTVTTKHYVLTSDASRREAEELGRVLEAAWPGFAAFFGAEPKLGKDERLPVLFFDTREAWARRLFKDGVPPPSAGGYYHPGNRTAYVWRQPTIYFTRCLLLHEVAHQFHFLAKTGNRSPAFAWYTEGLAEFLSRHYWDGREVTLGVVPTVTLEDSSRVALETISSDGFDLAKTLSDRRLDRPVSCALVRYLATAEKGKHRKKFDRLSEKLDRGAASADLLFRAFGKPAKLRRSVADWLATSQEPWSQIFNEWEGTAPGAFRGTAGRGIVSACRVKGDALRIAAVVKIPDHSGWQAGLLLSCTGDDDYTVALAGDGGWVKVHRRRGGKWERILDEKLAAVAGKKRLQLEATRSDGKVRVRIAGETIGEFDLPGNVFGLAIQGGVVEFTDVAWE